MHDMLNIRDLQVRFATPNGEVAAVRGFSLSIEPGECVGIVGESGAGKSQAMLALMGLLPANARVGGQARFESTELVGATPATLDRIRGASITMIFQDALTALTPHMRIGDQVAEPLVHHKGMSWSDARPGPATVRRRASTASRAGAYASGSAAAAAGAMRVVG